MMRRQLIAYLALERLALEARHEGNTKEADRLTENTKPFWDVLTTTEKTLLDMRVTYTDGVDLDVINATQIVLDASSQERQHNSRVLAQLQALTDYEELKIETVDTQRENRRLMAALSQVQRMLVQALDGKWDPTFAPIESCKVMGQDGLSLEKLASAWYRTLDPRNANG
jgi:hypothetical protein